MNDEKHFNYGGDALGGSEYFTGGCGCGGVEGGGPFLDTYQKGVGTLIKDIMFGIPGVKPMVDAFGQESWANKIGYFACGATILSMLLLIFMFAVGYESSSAPIITFAVLSGVAGVIWIGAEVFQGVWGRSSASASVPVLDQAAATSFSSLPTQPSS